MAKVVGKGRDSKRSSLCLLEMLSVVEGKCMVNLVDVIKTFPLCVWVFGIIVRV